MVYQKPMGKKISGWLFVLMLIILIACDVNRVFDESVSIQKEEWHYKDIMRFEVEVNDTLSRHNFFLNVRNTTDYKYSNIYFFLKTIFPDGRVVVDTLNIILADKEGKWIGKGSGKIRDNQVLISNALHFPQKGMYVFELSQAMRQDVLKGIADVGIRISTAKSQK